MTSEHDDDDRDDAPALPEREVLDAWRVPAPAPALTDRVLAHVEAALPLAAVAGRPVTSPRRGAALVVVGVAMLAAAAVVLGVAQSWRRPPATEPVSAAVAAPPLDAERSPDAPSAGEPARDLPAGPPVPAPAANDAGRAGADATPMVPRDLEDPFRAGSREALAPADEPTRIASIDLEDPFAGAVPPSARSSPDPDPAPSEGSPDLRNPFDRSDDRARTRASDDPIAPELEGVLIDPPPDDAAKRGKGRGGKAPPDDAAKTVTLRIGTAKGQTWAVVFIDGTRVGATPIMNAKVTPGRHRVRWEWADGTSSEQVVELAAGEVRTLKGTSPGASP